MLQVQAARYLTNSCEVSATMPMNSGKTVYDVRLVAAFWVLVMLY